LLITKLNFEEGETVYENKWVKEWVFFWRLVILMFPLTLVVYSFECYYNQSTPSPEFQSAFSLGAHTNNYAERSVDKNLMEIVNYWGKSMWLWQHWVRKTLFYFLMSLVLLVVFKYVPMIGKEYVTKMKFNRERDLVYIWTFSGYLRKV
jgi:hypothetical protein